MTNLEKLRSFSAEDLAEFLHNIRFTCYTCGKLNCPNSAFTDEVLKCIEKAKGKRNIIV